MKWSLLYVKQVWRPERFLRIIFAKFVANDLQSFLSIMKKVPYDVIQKGKK